MPSDLPSPGGGARYSSAQRRLLTAAAGIVVAALAAGAYVLTYDLLRDLAVAGRVGRRRAPVYPVMADALTAMTILSLVIARHTRWWTRLLRWALLLALVAGAAAISVQHAVWGFSSLPRTPVRTGVAVAPHVMLLIAVWLWLTMVKQIRVAHQANNGPEPDPERQRGHVKVIEPPAAPMRELEPDTRPDLETLPAAAAEPPAIPAPRAPALLPTDVELVRHRAADEDEDEPSDPARITQPDLIMPVSADEADGLDAPAVDRAEDPDAGDHQEHDGIPDGKTVESDELPIWDWNPPSSTFHSSPTPPAE